MAPAPFDSITQDESQVVEMDEIVRERTWLPKYSYLSPKTKAIVGGTLLGLLVIGVATVSNPSKSKSGSWPPPTVSSDYNVYDNGNKGKPVSLTLNLQAGKSYNQRTEMETSTSISYGSANFAETMHMTTENTIVVREWKGEDQKDGNGNDNGDSQGKMVDVTFTHLAVTTIDSQGDQTYYNSYAKTGDTAFDAVLETMIGETATIYLNADNYLVDEKDTQNALEEMEQEYSLGTTTGLSATDQVGTISNAVAFLPNTITKSSSSTFDVGETWDIEFETEVLFKGKSVFKGYTKYNGVECAVIESKATVDSEGNNQLMTNMDDMEASLITVQSGDVATIIFFDIKEQIPRYMKSTIVMTTDIGGVGGDYAYGDDDNDNDDEMELPMTEKIEMYLSPMK
mmetsp:Transcript_25122/g.37595  ORF Transcript_25122/g.37595 Transcript_25122/m.37595 type:complete len:398 (+) Transcript_25122:169-1362(+)